MRRVAWPEKFFRADEEIRIVLAPAHAATIAEVFFDARHRGSHRLDYKKTATDIKRTVLVRKRHRLFWREAVRSARCVVFNITTRRLINEPFPHIPFIGIGPLGQFGRRRWSTRSERLIESQLLSKVNQRGTEGRAKVRNDLTQKRIHLLFVNRSLLDCCRHNDLLTFRLKYFLAGECRRFFTPVNGASQTKEHKAARTRGWKSGALL